MEPVEIAFSVLLMGVGCVMSWLASWYYYLRARAERTSVHALVSAAHAKSRKTRSIDCTGKHPDVSLEMTLELIKAFEGGQVYYPELAVCARTYQLIGDLIGEALRAADEAGLGAGTTLSPRWFEAREKALKAGLARAKQEIARRLKEPPSTGGQAG